MDNILPDNEFVEVEGRVYSNPQTGLDESQSFIENLRSTQGQQNQQIATDTYNLGTAVPSVQGGLGAPTDAGLSYFTSRYQTPQTNATVANLKAVAQAAALNEVLSNEQEMWKKRYNDAYRAYQKSAYDKANRPTTQDTTTGGVDEQSTDLTGQGKLVLDDQDFAEGGAFIVDPASGNIIGEGFKGDNPRYVRDSDGNYSKYTTPTYSKSGNWLDLTGLITNYWATPKKNKNNTGSGFSGR